MSQFPTDLLASCITYDRHGDSQVRRSNNAMFFSFDCLDQIHIELPPNSFTHLHSSYFFLNPRLFYINLIGSCKGCMKWVTLVTALTKTCPSRHVNNSFQFNTREIIYLTFISYGFFCVVMNRGNHFWCPAVFRNFTIAIRW